jgi:hypothetical protein
MHKFDAGVAGKWFERYAILTEATFLIFLNKEHYEKTKQDVIEYFREAERKAEEEKERKEKEKQEKNAKEKEEKETLRKSQESASDEGTKDAATSPTSPRDELTSSSESLPNFCEEGKKDRKKRLKEEKQQKKKQEKERKKKEERDRKEEKERKEREERERKKKEKEDKERKEREDKERKKKEKEERELKEKQDKVEKKKLTERLTLQLWLLNASVPLEEVDFVRMEDPEEDITRKHKQQNVFHIQTRDYTFHYLAAATLEESTKWVKLISEKTLIAKERKRNLTAEKAATLGLPSRASVDPRIPVGVNKPEKLKRLTQKQTPPVLTSKENLISSKEVTK